MTSYETKDSGKRAQFESGMQRDTQTGKPRFDLTAPLDIPYDEQLLTRFAKLMGRGADKYTERNWEQADSEEELARMKSSAFRHFMQWYHGETDEDHAAAVLFNLMAFEATQYKMREGRGEGVDNEGFLGYFEAQYEKRKRESREIPTRPWDMTYEEWQAEKARRADEESTRAADIVTGQRTNGVQRSFDLR